MGKVFSLHKIRSTWPWAKDKASPDGTLTLTPDPSNRLQDQILGTIYGNCIGDAIGLMTEFLNKEQATKYYGGKHLEYPMKEITAAHFMHQMVFPEADWTDDSDQMILILQSLMDKGGKADAVDFASKLLDWLKQGFPELGDPCGMGVGRTTWKVLNNRDYRTDPHKAAANVWEESNRFVAPNGGVMRTSIVGVHRHDDINQVISNTKVFCKVTHADPRCVASCVAVTTAIAMMLQGQHRKPDGHYDVASLTEASFGYAKECLLRDDEGNLDAEQIEQLRFHMNASLRELELDDKKKIGYTFKCLGAGFWALRQDNFRETIEALTLEGGDADTNGAVAGALLGCKLGFGKLPKSWKNDLKHKKWLDDIIEKYFQMDIMIENCGTPVDGPEGGVRLAGAEQNKTHTVATAETERTDETPEPSEEVRGQGQSLDTSQKLADTDARVSADLPLHSSEHNGRSEVKPDKSTEVTDQTAVTDHTEVSGQSDIASNSAEVARTGESPDKLPQTAS